MVTWPTPDERDVAGDRGENLVALSVMIDEGTSLSWWRNTANFTQAAGSSLCVCLGDGQTGVAILGADSQGTKYDIVLHEFNGGSRSARVPT